MFSLSHQRFNTQRLSVVQMAVLMAQSNSCIVSLGPQHQSKRLRPRLGCRPVDQQKDSTPRVWYLLKRTFHSMGHFPSHFTPPVPHRDQKMGKMHSMTMANCPQHCACLNGMTLLLQRKSHTRRAENEMITPSEKMCVTFHTSAVTFLVI